MRPSLWFVAALTPMALSQLIRLHQSDAEAWLICDYAGRVGTLLVLAAIPAARKVAFQRQQVPIRWMEVVLWVVSLVVIGSIARPYVARLVNSTFFEAPLGQYPNLHGRLFVFDVVFGLALVAYTEETIFRRCARHVFRSGFGDGYAMVVCTSALFGAYHWWTSLGNVAAVTLLGVFAMLFYLRSVALWPVVLAHYLTDVVIFSA